MVKPQAGTGWILHLAMVVLLTACDSSPDTDAVAPEPDEAAAPSQLPDTATFDAVREARYEDLLAAGLGLEGMRGEAPLPADAMDPTSRELRRLAIRATWRGLVDLTESGGFGPEHPGLEPVPGREFHAFARLPDADQPFRVMVQLPDGFDSERACLLVAPASGSRGIYGGHPVAAPFGLARGCAVAYTDKGAGTDFFDHASNTGVALDGRRVAADGGSETGFIPVPPEDDAPLVSIPHSHAGENPEADWGRHVIAAAEFGFHVLNTAHPEGTGFTPDNTRVVAVGLSNGGGAVLRGVEEDTAGLFDAAVAVAPNITAPDARPLYDYGSQAALYQPCLLADTEALAGMPFGSPVLADAGQARCQALFDAGLLDAATPEAARSRLQSTGFETGALSQAAVNTALGLWRTITAMYASAYTGSGVDDMPCGYRVAAVDDNGRLKAASPAERNRWWATSGGMVPAAGLELLDAADDRGDGAALAGPICLRELWTADEGRAFRAQVGRVRASARLPDIPVVIIHGRRDGLIPASFSARPYVAAARDSGAEQLVYWEVADAQHFDVLVPMPSFSGTYRPLLPIGEQALDKVFGVLDGEEELGADRVIGD